jgi:hypothetical protein
MSAHSPKDRSSLCAFNFADGRQCRTPRKDGHPYLCTFHAHKEAQALAGQEAGEDIAYFLSGEYVSAGDLTFALGRLFAAVAQGQVKPKTAATLAYLGQTLVQTMHLAQDEFIKAFGTKEWRRTVSNNFNQSSNRHCPPADPAPTPDQDKAIDAQTAPDPAPQTGPQLVPAVSTAAVPHLPSASTQH